MSQCLVNLPLNLSFINGRSKELLTLYVKRWNMGGQSTLTHLTLMEMEAH